MEYYVPSEKYENWFYHVTIFEKLTIRLTALLSIIFLSGQGVLEPPGSTGDKIELIWVPEVSQKNNLSLYPAILEQKTIFCVGFNC